MQKPKTVLCIHDLCTVGRCSLTAIIPVLSAIGVQSLPLPTCVLSSHFFYDKNPIITDMSEQLEKSLVHFNENNTSFDCVFTGFLGSVNQVDVIENYLKNSNSYKLIDPVFADNGTVYSTVNSEYVEKIKNLASLADCITPNPTEAAFLLGEEYIPVYTKERLSRQLVALSEKFGCNCVITGAKMTDGTVVCGVFNNRVEFVKCDYIKAYYPGTGDIFASVLCGYIMQGKSLKDSVAKAANFVSKCVKKSEKEQSDNRLGVILEPLLPILMEEHT